VKGSSRQRGVVVQWGQWKKAVETCGSKAKVPAAVAAAEKAATKQ
jgi:hypothetical protein